MKHLSGRRLLLIQVFFVAILFLQCFASTIAASTNKERITICSPCSRTFLSDSYSTSEDSRSINCDSIPSISNANGNLELHRHLEGEGSHRRLISKFKFGNHLSSLSTNLDEFNCDLVIIESLHEVFADPFELQRLVARKVYHNAFVFGDTNLELPSALSNRSLVEIHMDLAHALNANHELIIELPLHARYPPLDANGYKTVEITEPQLYTRCRKKQIQSGSPCYWRSAVLYVGSTEVIKWLIPCGNEAHNTIVSSLTFIFALTCALSIVFASMFYNPKISTKDL